MGTRGHFTVGAGLLRAVGACTPEPKAVNATAASDAPAVGGPSVLYGDEFDRVKTQVGGCWYVDPNAKGLGHAPVDIEVHLSPDGTVHSARVWEEERMASDAEYREEAQSALRAVWKSSPFELPRAKYETWKHLHLHFDASGVLK
jgi:hypothetical protein